MNYIDKQLMIEQIQTAFVFVTTILTISFFTGGCISKSDPYESKPASSNIIVKDNAGISSVIREHFKTALGQIIAIENYQQASAQAIITVTTPAPDKVKVYLKHENDKWIIERIQNSIDETDMPD